MAEENNLELEKELKKFNWGAAYFGLIWALLNGCFKKWFVNTLIVSLIVIVVGLLLIFVPNIFIPGYSIMAGIFGGLIVPILMISIVFIYVGLKGNRWAWEGDKYTDIAQFNKIQKRWGIVAGVLLSLSILSIVLQFGVLYMISKLPTPENEINYVSKKACNVVYKKLPSAISKTNINDEDWISKVADELTKDDESMFGYGMDYTKKISISIFDKESVSSNKADFEVVKEPPCSISEANCYISAKTEDENMACRFYFDDSGKVVASKKTLNFLK